MSNKLEALCLGCFRVQNWENGGRIHTISLNKIVGNTNSQLKQKCTKISTGRMSLLQHEDYLPSHDENCESQANILKMGNFTYRSFFVSMSWACTLALG